MYKAVILTNVIFRKSTALFIFVYFELFLLSLTKINTIGTIYTIKPITVNNLNGHMAVYEIDSFMGCVIALDLGDGYTLQITDDYNYMTLNGHTPEELIGATYISYELIRY